MKTRCHLKIGFFTVLFVACLLLTSPHYFPALLCSVTLHELGHVIFARLCNIRFQELKLGIFGARLFPEGCMYSYSDEIVMCLGGPLLNFVTAFIAVKLMSMPSDSFFVMSSLALGTLNMLPISGFDGGRIFSSLLHLLLPYRCAEAVIKFISFLFLFTLWCISVYLLLRVGSSLTLFVFCLSMFSKIFIPDCT